MNRFLAILLGIMIIITSAGVVCGIYVLMSNKNKVAEAPKPAAEPIAEEEKDGQKKILDVVLKAEEKINGVSGKVQWGVNFYDEDYCFKTESQPVPSASVIKIFIMEYAYNEIMNERLSEQSVIGSQTLKSLLSSMITVSDNNATNVLIDYFGMDKLNAYFAEKGYSSTRLERKMLDTNAMSLGKDNYTSVDDVMKFLDMLYENKEEVPYSNMLGIMKNQQIKTKIQKNLPYGTTAATKTGELSDVENDIGIIFSENGDFAAVFLFSSLNNNRQARNVIAEVSRMFYDYKQ